MTRQEHLDWCKQRAFEYIEAGDLNGAFSSFASDVTKHHETENISQTVQMLGFPLLMMGALNTPSKMRKHIEGYS